MVTFWLWRQVLEITKKSLNLKCKCTFFPFLLLLFRFWCFPVCLPSPSLRFEQRRRRILEESLAWDSPMAALATKHFKITRAHFRLAHKNTRYFPANKTVESPSLPISLPWQRCSSSGEKRRTEIQKRCLTYFPFYFSFKREIDSPWKRKGERLAKKCWEIASERIGFSTFTLFPVRNLMGR